MSITCPLIGYLQKSGKWMWKGKQETAGIVLDDSTDLDSNPSDKTQV